MDTKSSKFARKPELLILRYPAKGRPVSIISECANDALGTAWRKKKKRAKSRDECASDIRLGQYYTQEDIAAYCYKIFGDYFDPTSFRMVEPSAGTGSFFKLLPPGSLAFDVEPKYDGIQIADFLEVLLERDRPIAVIGNPPFGKNASMAVKFFNHSAGQSQIVAMILPKTFRKTSIQNRLDPNFHLICDVTLPENAFLFRSKTYNVPAVFQIWERRSVKRAMWPVDPTHPDFEFTAPANADFAIQRVGARAGRVHLNFELSPKSHYFIRGRVNNFKAIMDKLDFSNVTRNTAGNPSLAKSEIVALYCDYISLQHSPSELRCILRRKSRQ